MDRYMTGLVIIYHKFLINIFLFNLDTKTAELRGPTRGMSVGTSIDRKHKVKLVNSTVKDVTVQRTSLIVTQNTCKCKINTLHENFI